MEVAEKGYTFDPIKHIHTLDQKRLHGVTSVLKLWGDPGNLVNWAANQAVNHIKEKALRTGSAESFKFEEGKLKAEGVKLGDYIVSEELIEEASTAHLKKRDTAGDKGKEIHKLLEDSLNEWIEDGIEAITETDPLVQKVINWMYDNGIKPLKAEMNVYSKEWFYGGIADGVVEKDGQKFILDFKTGGTIQTKAFLQCGAYSLAVKEMKPGAEIGGAVIVHIPRGKSFNPETNIYWMYNMEELEKAWLGIYQAYLIDKNLQKLIKY